MVEWWRTFCFGDHCRDNENESVYMKALRLWILKQRMLFLSRKHKRQWLTLLRHRRWIQVLNRCQLTAYVTRKRWAVHVDAVNVGGTPIIHGQGTREGGSSEPNDTHRAENGEGMDGEPVGHTGGRAGLKVFHKSSFFSRYFLFYSFILLYGSINTGNKNFKKIIFKKIPLLQDRYPQKYSFKKKKETTK